MIFRALLVATVMLTTVGGQSESQQNEMSRESFLVAVSDSTLPRGVRALVVRTAHGAQPDLIVLAPDADAVNTLQGAVATLLRLRAVTGAPARTEVHYVTYSANSRKAPPGSSRKVEAQLRRARGGVRRVISGIGHATVISASPGDFR